jgi:hypothetical protein
MWEQKKEDQPNCVKECGHCASETLYIDYYVKAKIDFLMEKYPNLEWLTYLIGDEKENIVRDMIIPPQKVSSGSVTDIETNPHIKIMGVAHSHHGLGLRDFSHTDHEYINSNHDLSILVWHGGIKAQKRVKLPCGSVFIANMSIKFFHESIDPGAWDKEAEENIKEKTYQTYVPGYGHYLNHYQGQNWDGWGSHYKETNEEKNENKKKENERPRVPRNYDDYLDALVYGDETLVSFENENEVVGLADGPSDAEVEAHFRRIEERECGIVKSLGPPKKAVVYEMNEYGHNVTVSQEPGTEPWTV